MKILKMNEYALLVALTYQDENGLGQLEQIVKTITFNRRNIKT
jgi:hypothetical protein